MITKNQEYNSKTVNCIAIYDHITIWRNGLCVLIWAPEETSEVLKYDTVWMLKVASAQKLGQNVHERITDKLNRS